MNAGERVKAVRELLGVTQEKLGQKYGIPKRTIEDWETGKMTPPPYVVRLLERVAEWDADIIEAYDNGSVHDEHTGAEAVFQIECAPTKWSEVAEIMNFEFDPEDPYTVADLKAARKGGYLYIYKDGIVQLYL